jgi:non-ribosomal peptide synthetase component F
VQERWRSGAFDSSVQFWQEQLQEPLPRLHLPADRDIPPPWRVSSQVTCCLDPNLVKRLRDLSRRHKTTLFRAIAAAIVAFFSRFSENDDLLVDIDFSVRPREMSRTVGFFANSLPLRFQIRPDETFDSLVREVDRRLRNVSANREVPVRRLGRKFGLHHVNERPLCSVMITQVGPLDWSVNELKLKGDAYVTATVHAMWLGVMERDDSVDLNIAYPDEVFNRERVEAWAAGIEQHLQLLSAAPHAPLLQVRGHPHNIQDSVLGPANLTTTELLRELEECP